MYGNPVIGAVYEPIDTQVFHLLRGEETGRRHDVIDRLNAFVVDFTCRMLFHRADPAWSTQHRTGMNLRRRCAMVDRTSRDGQVSPTLYVKLVVSQFTMSRRQGMSISPGFTTAEIREFVHDYEVLEYGRKRAWLVDRGVSYDRLRRWRSAVFEGDLDRGLIPRHGSQMTIPPAERTALERERARTTIAETAITAREPWTRALGPTPLDVHQRWNWVAQVRTVAAYRDRYHITDTTPLGTERGGDNQHADAQRAHAAIRTARQLTTFDPTGTPYRSAGSSQQYSPPAL
jgi:hypothetical protein